MLDLVKDCYNGFLLSLVKKHPNEHIIYCNFSFLIENSFWNLSSLLHKLAYLLLLNSFLFLNTFFVFLKSLNHYLFRWLAYRSPLSRFPVLINHTMWTSNLFSSSSCLPPFHGPGFSGFRFFRVQFLKDPGFQGPRFSGFRFFTL